jgi:hypothetical protein
MFCEVVEGVLVVDVGVEGVLALVDLDVGF